MKARDGIEAQNGLNDVFPGDEYPAPLACRIIDKPVLVRGEDFSYWAQCLYEFTKTNGKRRYLVEQDGRLFVQSPNQCQIAGEETAE
jgi:hypothetical protein